MRNDANAPLVTWRDVGMVFDIGLHEAILLAKFVAKAGGRNAPAVPVAIGRAVPDPFGAVGAAFETQGLDPDLRNIGRQRASPDRSAGHPRTRRGSAHAEIHVIAQISAKRSLSCTSRLSAPSRAFRAAKARKIVPIEVIRACPCAAPAH